MVLSFFGAVENSTITFKNTSNTDQDVSGRIGVDFTFTSTDLSVTLTNPAKVNATTGTQTVGANTTDIFSVSGSEQSVDTFTGMDIDQFLQPFDISVSTFTGLALSGGGGLIEFGAESLARGTVSVEYKVDPVSAIPLPASMPLLLAGLGGLWAVKRRRRRS